MLSIFLRTSVFWKYIKQWQMNKFGEPIASLTFSVDNYSNISRCPSAEIDNLRKSYTDKRNTTDIDKDFKMRNFGKSADKLEYGQEYVVDFIPIIDKEVASVKESLKFLRTNGYLIISGTIHPYLKDKEGIPKNKWLASIDDEKNLFERDGFIYFSCSRIDTDKCFQVQLAVASAGLDKNYYLIGVKKA